MTKTNHFEAFNTYGPEIIYVPEDFTEFTSPILLSLIACKKNDNGTGITSRLELLLEVIQIFA